MKKRVGLSKKTRFDVFERDRFTCQYCGKTPPDIELHCDHIIAISNGGTNDLENLRTACVKCNQGKGAKHINKAPVNELEKLKRIQENLEATRLAKEFAKASKQRKKLRDEICCHLCELTGKEEALIRNITGIQRAVHEFGPEPVMDWLDQSALTCGNSEQEIMKYFYGILRHAREGRE